MNYFAARLFLSLAWPLGILSGLGSLIILAYGTWTLTLTGHSYAQADLGLFMVLTMIGIPILIACGGVLLIGALMHVPSIRISLRRGTPLTYLLLGNLSVLALCWLFLLLMP